jgi:hypothetical protein
LNLRPLGYEDSPKVDSSRKHTRIRNRSKPSSPRFPAGVDAESPDFRPTTTRRPGLSRTRRRLQRPRGKRKTHGGSERQRRRTPRGRGHGSYFRPSPAMRLSTWTIASWEPPRSSAGLTAACPSHPARTRSRSRGRGSRVGPWKSTSPAGKRKRLTFRSTSRNERRSCAAEPPAVRRAPIGPAGLARLASLGGARWLLLHANRASAISRSIARPAYFLMVSGESHHPQGGFSR